MKSEHQIKREHDDAVYILKWVRKENKTSFSKTEVFRRPRFNKSPKERLENALNALIADGSLLAIDIKLKSGRGVTSYYLPEKEPFEDFLKRRCDTKPLPDVFSEAFPPTSVKPGAMNHICPDPDAHKEPDDIAKYDYIPEVTMWFVVLFFAAILVLFLTSFFNIQIQP